MSRHLTFQRFLKSAFDRAAAFLLGLLLLPVLLLVAGVVLLSMGKPVLFRQKRPGLHGEPFILLKFRTMANAIDKKGCLLSDAERLTKVGRVIRELSLDELPQLWNVIRGDMSLVGPRPLLVQYLERYTAEQYRRHDVLPGITGWTQVNGRNALSWSDKFRLDIWYVDNWSLWLDMRILAMTIVRVLQRKGISQPGVATADEFMGTAATTSK